LLFLKKQPLKVKFKKNFFPKVFTASPINIAVFKFREMLPTGNRLNSALFTKPKKKFRLPLKVSLQRGSRLKSIRPTKTMSSECFIFHRNRFTFGGVRPTAERVNTAKLCRRVDPIFDRGLASSRIITVHNAHSRRSLLIRFR